MHGQQCVRTLWVGCDVAGPAVCSDVMGWLRRCGTDGKDVLLWSSTEDGHFCSNRTVMTVCSRCQALTEQNETGKIVHGLKTRYVQLVLGAFAKLAKRLLASSCPSAWNNSGPTGRILLRCEISVFSKISRENQIS